VRVTGSESCPVAGFDACSVETLDSVTTVLIVGLINVPFGDIFPFLVIKVTVLIRVRRAHCRN